MWGVRGSQASPGPETVRYGGNTSCIEVRVAAGHVIVLDAGTGLRRLGDTLESSVRRVDILLTHLHLDHIQGLGFFRPLYRDDLEVNIWGPASASFELRTRLSRYMSPPLFPVRLRDLGTTLRVHDTPLHQFELPGASVRAMHVVHPGPTLGYRLMTDSGAIVAYLPDHEPALGVAEFPRASVWTSGYDLAAGADLLIHDCQFNEEEYATRQGWGHSALAHATAFADLARVSRLVPFHYDPSHDDAFLDHQFAGLDATPAREGLALDLG